MSKKYLKMLTEADLNKLNTDRLLNVMKSARAVKCAEVKRVAEAVEEFGEESLEVEQRLELANATNDYFKLVKSIADQREDV